MNRKILLIVLLLMVVVAKAELTEWRNIANTDFVTRITHDDEYINVATNGGGLVRINKQTGAQIHYNRAERGIPDNTIMNAVPHNSDLWLCNGYYGLAKLTRDNKIVPIDMTGTMTEQYVTALAFDGENSWWLGGVNNLYRFEKGHLVKSFSFYNMLSPFSNVSDIKTTSDGHTYVSWYSANSSDIGFFRLTNAGMEPVRSASNNETCGSAYRMAVDKNNSVWLATGDNGLVKYDGSLFTRFNVENSAIPTNRTSDVGIDSDGNVWGIGLYWLFKYDGRTFTVIPYKTNHANDYLLSLDIDGDDVYVGSRYQGVLKLENRQLTVLPIKADLLPSNALTGSGCVDKSGNFYGGALEGLVTYNIHNGKAALRPWRQMRETVLDKKGNLWLQWLDADTACVKIAGNDTTVFLRSSYPFNQGYVSQTKFDSKNRMWLATTAGAFCYDGTSWKCYNASNSGLEVNNVWCMDFDSKGNLWCGTYGGGLYKYDGLVWSRYDTPSDYIGAIAVDKNDVVWFNCRDEQYPEEMSSEKGYGLTCFDGNNMVTYNKDNSQIRGNFISDIQIDGDNNKWLALGGNVGVASFDGATWHEYTVKSSGLAHNEVLKIVVDSNDDLLWLVHYTGSGLSVAKLNSKSAGIAQMKKDDNNGCGTAYDLLGRPTTPSVGGVYIKNGKKWFGGTNAW